MKPLTMLVSLALLSLSGCKKDDAPAPSAAPAAAPAAGTTAPAAGTAAPAAPAAYTRTARSCAEIIAGLKDGMSKESVTPGSWGDVPKELQVVPPGGELCGATATRNTPVIRSALFGDALGAFYQPIATTMGCTWGGVEIDGSGDRKTTMVKLTCPAKPGGGASHIHTDAGSEFYYLSY